MIFIIGIMVFEINFRHIKSLMDIFNLYIPPEIVDIILNYQSQLTHSDNMKNITDEILCVTYHYNDNKYKNASYNWEYVKLYHKVDDLHVYNPFPGIIYNRNKPDVNKTIKKLEKLFENMHYYRGNLRYLEN